MPWAPDRQSVQFVRISGEQKVYLRLVTNAGRQSSGYNQSDWMTATRFQDLGGSVVRGFTLAPSSPEGLRYKL